MAGQPRKLGSITADGAYNIMLPSADKKADALGQNLSSYNLYLPPWPSVGQLDPTVPYSSEAEVVDCWTQVLGTKLKLSVKTIHALNL